MYYPILIILLFISKLSSTPSGAAGISRTRLPEPEGDLTALLPLDLVQRVADHEDIEAAAGAGAARESAAELPPITRKSLADKALCYGVEVDPSIFKSVDLAAIQRGHARLLGLIQAGANDRDIGNAASAMMGLPEIGEVSGAGAAREVAAGLPPATSVFGPDYDEIVSTVCSMVGLPEIAGVAQVIEEGGESTASLPVGDGNIGDYLISSSQFGQIIDHSIYISRAIVVGHEEEEGEEEEGG